MSAEKGSAFLLKIGDGGAPPVFATVAGMRTTQLSRQRRGGERDQQGQRRLARIAVGGGRALGLGGGERDLHRLGGGGAAEGERAGRRCSTITS